MNAPAPSPPRRRQVWPWVVGLLLTPFVALALLIASALRLNADATALRRTVMGAVDANWHTRVQITVPSALLSLVRTGIGFAHEVPAEARSALRAVTSASVGVYEGGSTVTAEERARLIAAADQAMSRRGWTRIVGVVDHDDTVLIYLPAGSGRSKPSRVCLAVCHERGLVVVAARFRPDALADLIAYEMDRHHRSFRL